MKAVTWRAFGAARDVLNIEELETPTPSKSEVLVRLAFSGVNPSDAKARSGTRPGVTKPPFDVIVPHSDGAGVIEAVGEGVDAARIGQRVWIWNGQWQRAKGTCAEYICLPEAQVIELPQKVSLETGAVLGIPGLTACHCVFANGEVAGKTILISGGGGSVGFWAVQLAKWGGATVLATCGKRDVARVRAAGADDVFLYDSDSLSDDILRATNGNGVDHAVEVEFGENVELLANVMASNGYVSAYGSAKRMQPELSFGPILFKALTVDVTLIYILPKAQRAAAIKRLHAALIDGAVNLPKPNFFSMEDAGAAHECVEIGGRVGSVLIQI